MDSPWKDQELTGDTTRHCLSPMSVPESPDMDFPLQDQELTRDNIRRCLSAAPVVYHMGAVRVVRVQKDVAVKYGPAVELQEARNMDFVRKATDCVNLPTLFDAWSDSESTRDPDSEPEGMNRTSGPISYIVMTFIDGTHLEHMWSGMTEQERTEIITRICKMLRALQRVKVEIPGPVGGGKSHGHFFTFYDAGPFKSVEDLQYWLNNRLRICKRLQRVPQDRHLFALNHELAMCHMDLHAMNIVVDSQGMPWLLDWGNSGAYPPYFEAANMLFTRGEEIPMRLYQHFHEPKHDELVGRLKELEYAFSTGALFYRGDIGIGNEY